MNIPYYMNNQNDIPVIPLPNPGEGGPVAPGGGSSNIPVIPLPNPGEGGPVYPGPNDSINIPVIPLPNPGEGGPVYPGPGDSSNIPVVPLPNPGEGGPVYPGSGGTIITVYPRPIIPCYFCNTNQFGNVRFFNTAVGYNPFIISVNGQTIVNTLDYAQISQYGRISSGYQTITISGQNGYIYIQKQVRITANTSMTIAIVNTASGLDLMEISDVPCSTPMNMACFRVCNLSYNGGPMNVVMNNGYVTFSNVRFGEVTAFNKISSGRYNFYVEKSAMRPQPRFGSSEILVSSSVYVQPNTLYTLYIFNWNTSPDAIRTMVVEDRQ